MDNNNINGTQEMTEIVLKELAEEQAKTNRVMNDLVTGVNSLTDKVYGITERMDQAAEVTTPELDTKQLQQVIDKGIMEIRFMIIDSQKKMKSTNFHLFIDALAKKWIVVLIISIVFLTYTYLLLRASLIKS